MILTYFIAVALFWIVGIGIWKFTYAQKKGER